MSPQDPYVAQLLNAGVAALGNGNHSSAVSHFTTALAASPDSATQHYVAYNLYQAGLYSDVLSTIEPYYQVDSAPSELAVIALSSAIRSNNPHVASFLTTHYQHTADPRLATVVDQANQFLATSTTPLTPSSGPTPYDSRSQGANYDQEPEYYNGEDSGEDSAAPYPWLVPWLEPGPKRTWAIVGLVVVLLLGWSAFRPKNATTTSSTTAYCSALQTLNTSPDISSPAAKATFDKHLDNLAASAPPSIAQSAKSYDTITKKLINTPQVPLSSAEKVAIKSDLTTLLTWSQTNCPASSFPGSSSGSSTTTGPSSEPVATVPPASPTPTSSQPSSTPPPPSATQSITGGAQSLPTTEGSTVSINITNFQVNAPQTTPGFDTSPTVLAIDLTITNTGSQPVDMGGLAPSDSSIAIGFGEITLSPTMDLTATLAPGATITGWITLSYSQSTPAPYNVSLTFDDTTNATWTLGG